tara:strand:- start:8636 stop:8803 length:168 start_codon:yes stop_codon:yes gene_type:complete
MPEVNVIYEVFYVNYHHIPTAYYFYCILIVFPGVFAICGLVVAALLNEKQFPSTG